MSTLKALVDRIIVRRVKHENSGLVHVVRRREDLPGHGDVVAVGPKVESVLPGDRVVFMEGAAKPLTFNGEDLLVVQDEFLMAQVTP